VGSVTINGAHTYTGPTVQATEVGTYTWHAAYLGDNLNNGASDNGINESVTTVKATPTISTCATITSGGVCGSAQTSDTLTVTGGNHPTGIVTFTLKAPDGTTSTVGTVTINGDGNYSLATTVAITQVGTYTWHASYAGDSLNNGAVDNGNNESVTTVKASPSISTVASITAGGVCGTATTTDKVIVTGGNNPTGIITFTLKAPNGSTTTVGTVTINGDGTYNLPTSVAVTQVGTYTWHATYAGDSLNGGAADNGANESVTGTPVPITIKGTKFNDITGNGFSCDDPGLSGVTINLYKESNNCSGLQTGSGGDTLVATTTTDSNGNYSFSSGLTAGVTYYVTESVPSGYLQTGGGPNGSAGCTYYTICAQSGQTYANNNFDDFYLDNCAATNISYTVYNSSCQTTTYTDLRGHTAQGNLVSVTFTIPSGASPDQVSLVSYTAPGSSFDSTTAYQQQIFDLATGTFGPGTYTLTVLIPNCYYQIDFVCGAAIDQLGPPCAGPDSANIFYTPQGRLFSADNGGTQNCGTGQTPIGKGDFALPSFWSSAKGQTLINTFDSPNSNTAPNSTILSQWLVTTFPDLYGAGAGTHSLVGLKNSVVATNFTSKFSGADQQVLATALSVYATSTNLAGTSAANLAKTDGFTISASGSGTHTYNVGSNNGAFGISTANATVPVLQLLVDLNAQTAPGAALSSGAGTVFTGINNSTGHLSLTASSADSGNADVALINSIQDLSSGTILVYVDNSQGDVTGDEQAAIDRAIASLNGDLSAFGVTLVDNSADPSGLMDSNIIITLAATSDIGGQADGVLGVTELGGSITLINTWNYSFSQTAGQDQYDFQTVATHELGHALGLGHSTDTNSVMFPYLSPGDARHDLTAVDLAVIEKVADTAPEPLMAASAVPPRAPAALGNNLLGSVGVPAVNAVPPQSQTASIGINQNSAFVQGAMPAAQPFQIGSSLVSTTPVSIGQQQKLDRVFSALNLDTDNTTSESLDVFRGENTQRQDWAPSSNFPWETQTDPWAGMYNHSTSEQSGGSDVSALDTYFAGLAIEVDDFGDY
jgi:Matrixin/Prealbumin-like fold domain